MIVAKIYFLQYLILLHVGSTYSMWFHKKLSRNNEIFFFKLKTHFMNCTNKIIWNWHRKSIFLKGSGSYLFPKYSKQLRKRKQNKNTIFEIASLVKLFRIRTLPHCIKLGLDYLYFLISIRNIKNPSCLHSLRLFFLSCQTNLLIGIYLVDELVDRPWLQAPTRLILKCCLDREHLLWKHAPNRTGSTVLKLIVSPGL